MAFRPEADQLNQGVWERNLKLLTGLNAVLAERAAAWRQASRAVTVLPARSGESTARLELGGNSFYLHSPYDPRSEARRWAEALGGDSEVLFLFGLGLGYHLEEFLARHPQAIAVVAEPRPEVLAAALGSREMDFLFSPRVTLLVSADPSELAIALLGFLYRYAHKAVQLHCLPVYGRVFRSHWEELQGRFQDLLQQQRVNVATQVNFAPVWFRNFVDNFISYLDSPGVASLRGRFAGRPGIIVSAGPSLEKNVRLLQAAKGRALIICAGSTIKVLKAHGVVPDLLVSVDPGEANYQHFADLDTRDVTLVYTPVLYPRIVAEYQGRLCAMDLDVFPFMTWLGERMGSAKGTVASGPSVANSAFDLACQLGCDPIIFVGQDLAYTNGFTHAAGAAHRAEVRVEEGSQESPYVYVKDIYGRAVPTTRSLHAMQVWFEQRIRALNGSRKVINATEGGAMIAGTDVCTLREVLDRYCRDYFEPEAIISQALAQWEPPSSAQYEALLRTLHSVKEEACTVDRLAGEGLRTVRRLMLRGRKGTVTGEELASALRQLAKLDRRITRLAMFQYFIRPLIWHKVEAANRVLAARANEAQSEAAKALGAAKTYATFFRPARQVSRQIAESLDRMRSAVEARLLVTHSVGREEFVEAK
ncbi:MAG: DUF115 domain-containing protein [Clostridia bacterium]|jgi:hypothetical protein|nr:DUF115 domain-containing protein [Clostridia bacterium]